MAKPLVFQYGEQDVEMQFSKIDRAKLYGYKEIEVVDESGVRCELATLAEDGKTVVGKGGTAMAYLSVDGNWCERSELKPVNLEGDEIRPVSSSFSAPIALDQVVDSQEYLNHNIRALYEMSAESFPESLLNDLREGKIFKFAFSYRGGLEADAGFLLTNAQHEIFMAVGTPTTVEFIGLAHDSTTVADADEVEGDLGGLMDFDMI